MGDSEERPMHACEVEERLTCSIMRPSTRDDLARRMSLMSRSERSVLESTVTMLPGRCCRLSPPLLAQRPDCHQRLRSLGKDYFGRC